MITFNVYINPCLFFFLQCEFDPVTVGFSIICVMVGLLWTALFCLYASNGIEHIEDIGYKAYNMKWYDFPVTFQKFIILHIVRSQEEIHFTGWGMVYCNLEALGNVRFSSINCQLPSIYHTCHFYLQIINSAISYYLIFRELNQLDK